MSTPESATPTVEPTALASSSAGPLVRIISAVLAEHPAEQTTEQAGGPTAQADHTLTAEDLLRDALAQRHVEVEEVMPGHLLFRFAGYIIGGMQGQLTTLVSEHSRRIAADQKLLERFLRHADVAVPEGSAPPVSTAEEAPAAEGEDSGEEDTDDEASGGTAEQSSMDVEVFVVGDEAIAALLRTPAFEHTSEGLVFTDNGEQQLTVDVTDLLAPGLRALAADAVTALPGLAAASVTVRTPGVDSAEDAVVTGITVAPDILSFHRPNIGRGRDASGALAEKILRRASR